MAALLAGTISVASAQSAPDGPAASVVTVIGMDKGGWGSLFAEKPTALMKRYFTPNFNRSWSSAMTHNQEGPVLDGDPITGWQSVSKVVLKSTSVAQNGEQATVTAHVLVSEEGGRPKPETIVFDVRREGDAWKIDDIKDPNMPSIRAYFRKSYGG